MLTARFTEIDGILGLEIGADDYLTNPFSIRELLARAKALFRHVSALPVPGTPPIPDLVQVGDLLID